MVQKVETKDPWIVRNIFWIKVVIVVVMLGLCGYLLYKIIEYIDGLYRPVENPESPPPISPGVPAQEKPIDLALVISWAILALTSVLLIGYMLYKLIRGVINDRKLERESLTPPVP